jgi:hypothetical protein
LANEAATWSHLGLIDDALAQILAQRYDARGSAGFLLLKWLGLFGYVISWAMVRSRLLPVISILFPASAVLRPLFLIALAIG